MIKRIIALLLCFAFLTPCLASCGDEGAATLLSFAQTMDSKSLSSLDGKKVSIIGYISTLSPVDGSFIYLMNLPYQSCPFCIPNSDNELSNTVAVYAKSGRELEYTDRAVKVTGTLKYGFTRDVYGYTYNFKIANASYEILDSEDMSENLRLWQALASTEVVSEIYNMYDYVDFLCAWTTRVATWQTESGSFEDYIYPNDVMNFLNIEGDMQAQFEKIYTQGDAYFDDIVATIREVDPNAFEDLVLNVLAAKELANRALNEYNSGNYYSTSEYSGKFEDGRVQYKLNKQDELISDLNKYWEDFSTWLGSWEL